MSSTTQKPFSRIYPPTTLSQVKPRRELLPVQGVPNEELVRTQEQVEAIFAKQRLSKEAEEEALDTEIRIGAKHVDLTELNEGRYPERLIAEWKTKGGFWSLMSFALKLLSKVL